MKLFLKMSGYMAARIYAKHTDAKGKEHDVYLGLLKPEFVEWARTGNMLNIELELDDKSVSHLSRLREVGILQKDETML